MSTLQLHTVPKAKPGNLHETRTDGESYHLSFTAGPYVFTCSHYFGNEVAQQRALDVVEKAIRDGVDVLVNK
jgi:hypothetical protein